MEESALVTQTMLLLQSFVFVSWLVVNVVVDQSSESYGKARIESGA